jgi:hypothetical protein
VIKSRISFNPIIVRFKLFQLLLIMVGISSFNPIIVRFKLDLQQPGRKEVNPFNPIIVRTYRECLLKIIEIESKCKRGERRDQSYYVSRKKFSH